ncbi:DsrE family protein [Aquimarina sp. D1M17]|uniref:DsrE family protein n=1 Tax=Aquimarina acroporae TaxID=2937283 RepID=UPI0020C189CD|nr:DsrE family protein [Aquimarina acroporae]MCK8524142.1 DsrE family protein [Aquimarina acroporae]
MKNNILIFTIVLFPLFIFSQKKGKIITEYGNTYEVNNPDFKTDLNKELKVVFDVGRTFKDSTKVNPLINTAARYLNMHVDAGVAREKLKVALVIHGNAANDVLTNANYKSIYGIDNPNAKLISKLSQNGVQVVLCGQTAAHRGITKNDVLPEIQFALSAMTALVQLQNNNYRLINF